MKLPFVKNNNKLFFNLHGVNIKRTGLKKAKGPIAQIGSGI
jgi:hypothetical protein